MYLPLVLNCLFLVLVSCQPSNQPFPTAVKDLFYLTKGECSNLTGTLDTAAPVPELQSTIAPMIKQLFSHPGVYSSNPATSCYDLIASYPDVPPGYYWVQPASPVKVYCNFYGFSQKYPSSSCAAIKTGINPPSDYYWLSGGDGSSTRLYCEMTKTFNGTNNNGWLRIINFNASSPDQQCPSSMYKFERNSPPYGSCRRNFATNGACASGFFSSGGVSYSKVCGWMRAFSIGSPDAFQNNWANGVSGWMFDGIALLSGTEFVWGFLAAVSNIYTNTRDVCTCTNSNNAQNNYIENNNIPDWIRGKYFCEAGTEVGWQANKFLADDPLWDGMGCPSQSSCCTLNNPPNFCTTLSQPTTEDMEIRLCLNQHAVDEDIGFEIAQIYVQ